MPTIKDVAKKAGVSITAVSFVINNVPVPLSERTKQKIREAIKELGYVPNRSARTLAKRRTETIALLFRQPLSSLSPGVPSLQILAGVGARVALSGHRLLLIPPSSTNDEEVSLARKLNRGEADGAIVVGPIRLDDPSIKQLEEMDFPIILMGYHPEAKRISCIDIDNFGGAYKGVDYLAKLGHERIGFIGSPLIYSYAVERFEGYKKALEDNGLPYREEWVSLSQTSVEEGYKSALSILRMSPRPTALFVSTGMMGVGALRAIEEEGLKVPSDIFLLTLQEFPSGLLKPLPAVLCPPFYRLGIYAVTALFAIVNKKRETPINKRLPMHLKIYSS